MRPHCRRREIRTLLTLSLHRTAKQRLLLSKSHHCLQRPERTPTTSEWILSWLSVLSQKWATHLPLLGNFCLVAPGNWGKLTHSFWKQGCSVVRCVGRRHSGGVSLGSFPSLGGLYFRGYGASCSDGLTGLSWILIVNWYALNILKNKC